MKILSWCYVLCSHVFLQALSSWPHLSMLFQGFYLCLHQWAWGCGVLVCSSFGRAGRWDLLNVELRVWAAYREGEGWMWGPNRTKDIRLNLNNQSALLRNWADFAWNQRNGCRCSASLELRSQDIGCQIQDQGTNKPPPTSTLRL